MTHNRRTILLVAGAMLVGAGAIPIRAAADTLGDSASDDRDREGRVSAEAFVETGPGLMLGAGATVRVAPAWTVDLRAGWFFINYAAQAGLRYDVWSGKGLTIYGAGRAGWFRHADDGAGHGDIDGWTASAGIGWRLRLFGGLEGFGEANAVRRAEVRTSNPDAYDASDRSMFAQAVFGIAARF